MTRSTRVSIAAVAALLGTWSRRELRARYKQTLLGLVWAVAQPAGVTVALVFLLKRIGSPAVPGVAYASFVFPGMLCWTLFASGVLGAVGAVAASMPVVAKIRFPRVVAPVSGAVLPLVDFALATIFLPPLLLVQGSGITPRIYLALFAIIGTLMLSVGVGCFLGALGVFIRDLRNGLPFALQLLLLASPVAYPADRLPDSLRWSPVATYISAFRSAFVDTPAPGTSEMLRAAALSAVALVLGVAYFRSVEDRFADVA